MRKDYSIKTITSLAALLLIISTLSIRSWPSSVQDATPTNNPQPPTHNQQFPVTEVRLDNGLKVLLQEVHTNPLVSVWCWYRVGSKDEQIGATGISHWVEHMNFKGTQNFSKARMRSAIEDYGGYWNGYTSLDQTTYFETVGATALDEMLRLEAERMSLSLFDPPEVKSERTVVISELQGSENDPKNLLDVDVTAAAFKAHPYRWPTIGWLKDLETLSRDQLYQFYRQYYIPNNAILVLVGDFHTPEALELVKKYFTRIPRKPDPIRLRTTEPEQQGERRIKIVREGTTPYLQITYRAPDIFNDEYYALLILDAALNGAKGLNLWSSPLDANATKSSRLYKALIDKKLATYVNSNLVPAQNPYLYKLTVTLPDIFQYQPAEEAIYDELEKIKNYGLTSHELSKAKNQWVARAFLDQDTATKLAHQLGYFESIASYKFLNALEEKINQVSPDDLRRVAIKYFTDRARTVGWFVPVQKKPSIDVEKLSAEGRLPITRSGFENDKPELIRPWLESQPARETPGETLHNWKSTGSFQIRSYHVAGSREGPASDGITTQVSPPKISLSAQKKVLSNGVSVVVVENSTSPTLTIKVSMKAGAMRDSDEKAGTAYFVGQMLEHGTKTRNVYQIAEGFDFLGADLKTNTDYLVTSFTVNGLKKDAGTFIPFLAEMFQSPSFPQSEVEKVRMELLTELRQEADDTELVADQILRERIYPPGHPFRRKVEGTVKAVEGLKSQDLLSFYRRYYRPDQLIVCVAGDIKPEAVFQLVEKSFGGWSVQGTPESFSIPAVSPGLGMGEQVVTMKNKSQCDIAFGFPGISIHSPNYYPMLILNQIFGQAGLGGRVGDRIRDEEGLAYYAYSSFDASLCEGPFVIRAGVNPERVDRAVTVMKEEIEKLKARNVTEMEVKAAKKYLIHSLPIQLESNEAIARQMERIELFQLGIDYLERYAELIEGVKMENVLDCIRTRLSFDQAALVIAGPYERK